MACPCGCGSPTSCGAPPFALPVPSPGEPPARPDLRSREARQLPLCGTLARTLVGVADSLRDLYTTFGLRPYVVRIVRTRWMSGHRNVGVEIVEDDPIALLPTPRVSDLTALAEINTPVGLDEFGEVLLTQVSGAYTDDLLRGRDGDGNPVDDDENIYYEIEFPPPCDGREGERRRFVLKGAPMYQSDQFQWSVRLERARSDRTRAGDPA